MLHNTFKRHYSHQNRVSTLVAEALQWRHNGHDSVSNHQPHDCLLNRLFRCRSKKTSKFRVTGLCAGNLPGTGGFPAQMASYAENVSIWWRHHGLCLFGVKSSSATIMMTTQASGCITRMIQNDVTLSEFRKLFIHSCRLSLLIVVLLFRIIWILSGKSVKWLLQLNVSPVRHEFTFYGDNEIFIKGVAGIGQNQTTPKHNKPWNPAMNK